MVNIMKKIKYNIAFVTMVIKNLMLDMIYPFLPTSLKYDNLAKKVLIMINFLENYTD